MLEVWKYGEGLQETTLVYSQLKYAFLCIILFLFRQKVYIPTPKKNKKRCR